MVSNEKYINLLKSMISCVSHGDYSSVKELSNLELGKMEQRDKKVSKEIKKIKRFTQLNKQKNKPLEEWDNRELIQLIEMYSKYVLKKIEDASNLGDLKIEIISVEEFIKKM